MPDELASYFPDSDPCWLRPQNLASFLGVTVSLLAEGPVAETLAEEAGRAVGSGGRVVRGLSNPQPQLLLAQRELLAAFSSAAEEDSPRVTEALAVSSGLGPEGYVICGDGHGLAVVASDGRGLLYGYFHLLRLGKQAWTTPVHIVEQPAFSVRMLNQWDNTSADGHHGSVERGYAGASIFFRNDRLVAGTHRIRDYARLLASVGINAISINNVNVSPAATRLLTEHLTDVARVAEIFRRFGISTYLSVNFASPIISGDLSTADPLDPDVVLWWQRTAERLYAAIPDFGGFLVKADSEGQPGPFTYGRDHVDGANLLAGAVKPFGGRIFWRCFVYNHKQDWRDRSTDRARAAYDHFLPIDGRFADNVVLQVKNGPMDFQVREPVSPLLLGLRRTNTVAEFQITQEYTGHQIDLCYLVPLWRDALSFPTEPSGAGDAGAPTVASTLVERGRAGATTGVAAVSNIGDDRNWTGNALAQANLYGFGRVAWDPLISSDTVLDEWISLTFDDRGLVRATVRDLLRTSWPTYESYTAPLGVGWMVTPGTHYGPSVDGYEYSKWGTYHFADRDGIGVDRTVRTGTGYAGQYPPEWAEVYESLESCSDELLLFFHHVPYTHLLHSGKTVIQHIYDTHFEGAARVEEMREQWRRLEGDVDQAVYGNVLERLDRQVESAHEWRDQVNTYFFRKSGMPDAQGRTIF